MTKFHQTTIQAIQTHTCLECGAAEATPYPGDTVPYCPRCKREHAKRRKNKEPDE